MPVIIRCPSVKPVTKLLYFPLVLSLPSPRPYMFTNNDVIVPIQREGSMSVKRTPTAPAWRIGVDRSCPDRPLAGQAVAELDRPGPDCLNPNSRLKVSSRLSANPQGRVAMTRE